MYVSEVTEEGKFYACNVTDGPALETLMEGLRLNTFLTTQCKMEVRILSGGVTKNLTLHGMSKIDFQPDFRNALMLSFLLMYNTMGSKVNGLAVREHFL